MEATNQNHHAETVAVAKQQRKHEPFRSALRLTFEDAASPPSFPLQRRRELHLCTSNQIRDHHGSSGDVSSIAAANQNSTSSNHASTDQRGEFSHRSSVLNLAGSTHRESFLLMDNWETQLTAPNSQNFIIYYLFFTFHVFLTIFLHFRDLFS